VLRNLPDAEVRFVWHKPGPIAADSGALLVGATHSLDETPSPDIVLVPGGISTFEHARDEKLLDWVRRADQTSTWTTSVCSGSVILAAAGLLKGRRATSHWLVLPMLKPFGVETVGDERIVHEGKLVTAAGVSAGIDLAMWLFGQICGEAKAKAVQLAIEYDPQPPFDSGHVSKASAATKATATAQLSKETLKQHQLSQSYERRAQAFRLPDPKSKAAASPGVTAAQIRAQARRYRLASKRGQGIGRLRVPRLGLNMVVVDGTDHDSLTKGPGLDRRTYMPGEGQLVYIAGHRTTYLAPFAHIERMKAGDRITLEVPYGTFRYRVFTHRIVTADDLAVLKSRGREIVELQACHPRFFASHRYIVYARLMQIDPRGAPSIRAPARTLAAAPLASTQG